MGRLWLCVGGLLTVLFAYHLYQPLPDGIAEPWKTRQILAIHKLVADVCWIGSKLQIDTYNNLFRFFIDLNIGTLDREGLQIEDDTFNGVPVRIYRPIELEPKARGVVYLHGGGWMWGSIDSPSYDKIWTELARRIPAVIVAVSYRLAPENPYPIPFQDCVDATLGFFEQLDKYSVDKNRVAIAGDSAGGNLAAAVALKLRDMKNPGLKAQILVYPVLQVFDLNLPSYVHNSGKVWGSSTGMAYAALAYMGLPPNASLVQAIIENKHTSMATKKKYSQIVDAELLPNNIKKDYKQNFIDGNAEIEIQLGKYVFDPYMFPLVAENLHGLPNTYVMNCEFDILRDDGLIYGKRLVKAGVDVKLKNYKGGYHGIFNYIAPPLTTEIGLKSIDDFVKYVEHVL